MHEDGFVCFCGTHCVLYYGALAINLSETYLNILWHDCSISTQCLPRFHFDYN